jgi:DNA (cytosine-5)-methyltransferase 1
MLVELARQERLPFREIGSTIRTLMVVGMAEDEHAPRVGKGPPVPFARLKGAAASDYRHWLERTARARSRPDGQQVRDVSEVLFEVARRVAATHGTPDLGNKSDPVDELVYIILSRRTRETAYQRAFDMLQREFTPWEALAEAPLAEIAEIVSFCGLGWRKAMSLKSALQALVNRFGSCTLEPTRNWSDEEVADFLCTLPEVGPKSAACVMMCSLDRAAFPVDAHVGRVLERLGVMAPAGIDLRGRDHKAKQALLWDAVPPSLRYPLHVNLLVHGRLTCLPRRPRCSTCVLRDMCLSAAESAPAAASGR